MYQPITSSWTTFAGIALLCLATVASQGFAQTTAKTDTGSNPATPDGT